MPNLGTGSSLAFTTSGFKSDLLNIEWQGINRDGIEISSFNGNSFQEFIASSQIEPGAITCEIAFNPNEIPDLNDNEELQIRLSDGSLYIANVFVVAFSWKAQLEEKLVAEIELKVTGPWVTGSTLYLKNDSYEQVYTDSGEIAYAS